MDLDLNLITHEGARRVLAWARGLGVRVVNLDSLGYNEEFVDEISYDYSSQDWMDKFGASRCPVDIGSDMWVYTQFGNPANGVLGVLFVSPRSDWDGLPYAPEIILLHEVAHAVVGLEECTCIWEAKVCRILFTWPGAPTVEQVKDYQAGSDCEDLASSSQVEISQQLTELGLLPVQNFAGAGVDTLACASNSETPSIE